MGIKHFTIGVANHVKDKVGTLDYEIRSLAFDRMNICKQCSSMDTRTERCKICRCFLELKTKVPNAKCPINKW